MSRQPDLGSVTLAETPRTLRGFTLIELMIVTVIIGIVVGIASLGTRRVQVKAHLASVVADGRILYQGLEEFYTIAYRYPNSTSNPAFDLVTFEPLRSQIGYQGSINSRLLNGQADSYDSPDDQGPNQEWWVQMTLAIGPRLPGGHCGVRQCPAEPGGLDAGCLHLRGWDADRGTGGAVSSGLVGPLLGARRQVLR